MLARNKVLAGFGFHVEKVMESVLPITLPLMPDTLEIATGKGRFTAVLAGALPRVDTIEIDKAEQRVARLNAAWSGVLHKIRFHLGDAAGLPWPDRHFGSVVSVNTMHHLNDPMKVLAEMVRVTCPGGKIVISDFDEEGFEIMERIHAAEGNTHPRGNCAFVEIGGFLAGCGWSVSYSAGICQQVVIGHGPEAIRQT
jgi:ubiquinone/menaquinone biosynthesis C-methylase UbiE